MSDIVDFEDESLDDGNLFDCEYTSIDAVINAVTVFTGAKLQPSENGDRVLIAYGEGVQRSAFFTDSKKLRDVVLKEGRTFPFRAMIKVVSYGNMYGFRFFSPSSEVTDQDRMNFENYKRYKRKSYR